MLLFGAGNNFIKHENERLQGKLNAYHFLVLESLEVLELSLGGLVTLWVCLVEELAASRLGLVVDVGGRREPALGQLGHKVQLGRHEGSNLHRLLLALVVDTRVHSAVKVDVFLSL